MHLPRKHQPQTRSTWRRMQQDRRENFDLTVHERLMDRGEATRRAVGIRKSTCNGVHSRGRGFHDKRNSVRGFANCRRYLHRWIGISQRRKETSNAFRLGGLRLDGLGWVWPQFDGWVTNVTVRGEENRTCFIAFRASLFGDSMFELHEL